MPVKLSGRMEGPKVSLLVGHSGNNRPVGRSDGRMGGQTDRWTDNQKT